MTVCQTRFGCGAAIVTAGRILLVERLTAPEAGHWGLPGGKVEPSETAAIAAEREIREELGIEIEAAGFLCLVDQIDPESGAFWMAPVYLVRSFRGEPMVREPEKLGGLAWYPLDDLPSLLTTPTIQAIAALRSRQEATIEVG